MAAPLPIYGYSFMSCKLRVDTSHPKWQRTLRKVLDRIQVYSFNMDEDGTVVVSGRTNPYVLLKTIGKVGRRAELIWLQSGECSNCLYMPPSTTVPPPPVADDFDEDDPYVDPRGRDPYYAFGDYYGGGFGNRGQGGYGGYNGSTQQPSYGPYGEWAHLLNPFFSPSPGW